MSKFEYSKLTREIQMSRPSLLHFINNTLSFFSEAFLNGINRILNESHNPNKKEPSRYDYLLVMQKGSTIFDISDQKSWGSYSQFQSFFDLLKVMSVRQRERLKNVISAMEENKNLSLKIQSK